MTNKALYLVHCALALAVLLILSLIGCTTFEPIGREAYTNRPISKTLCIPLKAVKTKVHYRSQKLIETARTMMGTRYKYGGIAPQSGFDCSGFTRWVYGQHGIDLPRSSVEQFEIGQPIGIAAIQPGDLVFFRIQRRNQSLHVGIATGTKTFIHSPNKGNRIREESFLRSYWLSRYIGTRRVLN